MNVKTGRPGGRRDQGAQKGARFGGKRPAKRGDARKSAAPRAPVVVDEAALDLAPGASTLAAAAAAAAAVAEVAHGGRSADDALLAAESRGDRAAVRAIALGTLRWYLRLAPAVVQLLKRAPEDMAPPLRSLLVAAAHQIEYSRAAPEVSVHLAVDAAKALGLGHASGFVNAVLRRFVTERARLLAEVDLDPALASAHPIWFAREVAAAWPGQAAALLAANNEHPPMVLRVAAATGSAADYVRELASDGRPARALDWCPGAVVLEHAMSVAALPGFREGRVSVQDAGAQLAAKLLDVRAGQRVLDACAAPGGKTGHILETAPKIGDLLAADIDAARLAQVGETLQRLGRSARCRVLDLREPSALSDEAPFDRILLDAPCSSTGVIRRHPDIKLLRRATDIPTLAAQQAVLLRNAFVRLAPNGLLLYATCSVLPTENERVVEAFLAAEPRAVSEPWPDSLPLPPGAQRLACGTQLLPGADAGTDGFYYALIRRRAG